MGLLVLADGGEELVGSLVSSGTVVPVVDLLLLSRLARREDLVQRRDPHLQVEPRRDPDRRRVGDCDPHLPQPRLDAPPVPTLRLGHTPQDLGLAGVLGTFRQQLVNLVRLDFSLPRLKQPRGGLRAFGSGLRGRQGVGWRSRLFRCPGHINLLAS